MCIGLRRGSTLHSVKVFRVHGTTRDVVRAHNPTHRLPLPMSKKLTRPILGTRERRESHAE